MKADNLMRKTTSLVSLDCNGRRLFLSQEDRLSLHGLSWFLMWPFCFLTLLQLLLSILISRIIPHVKWVGFFVVIAVGEPVCFFYFYSGLRTERLHKGSWYSALLASLQRVSRSLIRNIFLNRLVVLLKRSAEEVIYFSCFSFNLMRNKKS